MAYGSSYQYRALVACHELLIANISQDPNSITDVLFQHGILSDQQRDIQGLPMTKTDKARKLVVAIQDKVKLFPERYEDIINILKDNFEQLVVELRNKADELMLADVQSEATSQDVQSQDTIISTLSEDEIEGFYIRLKCSCNKCKIKKVMKGSNCPKKTPIHLELWRRNSTSNSPIQGKDMKYSDYKVALQQLAHHMQATYCACLSSTMNKLKAKYSIDEIKNELQTLLNPQGAKGSIYSRMYDRDRVQRLGHVKSYIELKDYFNNELCSWFNMDVIIDLGKALLLENAGNISAYKQQCDQYIARCCFSRVVGGCQEIVCKVPTTDFRALNPKQVNYFEHKLRQVINLPECDVVVDENSGELFLQVKQAAAHSNKIGYKSKDSAKKVATLPVCNSYKVYPYKRDGKEGKDSKLTNCGTLTGCLCFFLPILLAISLCVTLIHMMSQIGSVYYSTTPLGSAVIHGNNSVTELFNNINLTYVGDHLRITKSNKTQVSIFIGACRNVHLQNQNATGKLTQGKQQMIFQSPRSTLILTITSAKTPDSICIATLVKLSKHSHFRTCITDLSDHNFTFEQSTYLSLNAWVDFNFTITAEALLRHQLDFRLGCSMTPNQQNCSMKKYIGLSGNVCVYGISSSDNTVVSGYHITGEILKNNSIHLFYFFAKGMVPFLCCCLPCVLLAILRRIPCCIV